MKAAEQTRMATWVSIGSTFGSAPMRCCVLKVGAGPAPEQDNSHMLTVGLLSMLPAWLGAFTSFCSTTCLYLALNDEY